MKQNTTLKYLFLSAAAALALAVSARADTPLEATPLEATTPIHQGLLGQQYASLTYSYINLDRSPVNADNFEFAVNQPLNTGLDAVLAYDWTQSHLFAGSRLNTQDLTAGLRAFCNSYGWGKPYVEAGMGYAWQRGTPSGTDHSILWRAAIGAELQLAPAFSVTPYVEYVDAPDLASSRRAWNFGANANYWIDSQWAVTAGLARDDHQNNRFTVGTNFRF
ncbi:MAG: hypothetical protein ABUL65_01990 [Opitutus sp.]